VRTMETESLGELASCDKVIRTRTTEWERPYSRCCCFSLRWLLRREHKDRRTTILGRTAIRAVGAIPPTRPIPIALSRTLLADITSHHRQQVIATAAWPRKTHSSENSRVRPQGEGPALALGM
jgi:hypothetical protein